jgi:hypothetical protein
MKLHFSAYDLPLEIHCEDESLVSRLLTCLPPQFQPQVDRKCGRVYKVQRHGETRFELWVDSTCLVQSASFQEILDVLEGDIQLYVAEFARPWVFLHAGAVVWRGRAIVLPGSSFAGKSTLVAALLRAGAQYLSDEYAVLDRHARVYPYSRRLSLRIGRQAPLRCTPFDLGAETCREPAPIGLVGLFSFRPSSCGEVCRLSSAQALLGLLLHAVPARQRPRDVLEALTRIVAKVSVLSGERGEADAFAAWLLEASARDSKHNFTSDVRENPYVLSARA